MAKATPASGVLNEAAMPVGDTAGGGDAQGVVWQLQPLRRQVAAGRAQMSAGALAPDGLAADNGQGTADELRQGIAPGHAALVILQPLQHMQDTDPTGVRVQPLEQQSQNQAAEGGDPEPMAGFHSDEMAGLSHQCLGLQPFGQHAEGDDGEAGEQTGQQTEQGSTARLRPASRHSIDNVQAVC